MLPRDSVGYARRQLEPQGLKPTDEQSRGERGVLAMAFPSKLRRGNSVFLLTFCKFCDIMTMFSTSPPCGAVEVALAIILCWEHFGVVMWRRASLWESSLSPARHLLFLALDKAAQNGYTMYGVIAQGIRHVRHCDLSSRKTSDGSL